MIVAAPPGAAGGLSFADIAATGWMRDRSYALMSIHLPTAAHPNLHRIIYGGEWAYYTSGLFLSAPRDIAAI